MKCKCRRGACETKKELRLEMMSRMSHTAMQEVFIKTVHMPCKQKRRCALWNGLTHAM